MGVLCGCVHVGCFTSHARTYTGRPAGRPAPSGERRPRQNEFVPREPAKQGPTPPGALMAVLPFDNRDGSIWYDGRLVPWREAKTHVLTHGLHYASSIFEGQRLYR